MKKIATLLILLICVWCKSGESKEIRVLIRGGKERVELKASSGFEVVKESNGLKLFFSNREIFQKAKGGILVRGNIIKSSLIIDSSSLISVSGRRYRGRIRIMRGQAGLDLINILDIESYLYGVIKWEISPLWSFEAVKAQAIASRTFAYANIGRHKKKGYDLCSSEHCQVYGGFESEDPRAEKAVDLTKGKIITLNGKPINALFHATCGGETTEASLVWRGGNELWYLKGVRCTFCEDSPHYHWSLRISLLDIERALRKNGLRIGKIHNIYPIKKDSFGRISKLLISHTYGDTPISANSFRLAIGSRKVRSTLFTLQKWDDHILLNGRGWGHGVGMCQWGAKGMAESGFSHIEILSHYYPGTTISTIE